ncbi:MAG: tetratricopeptide repeat protein [Planctomycetota bacterium]|jgi:tetratricopeptide (TPR) repeat protein
MSKVKRDKSGKGKRAVSKTDEREGKNIIPIIHLAILAIAVACIVLTIHLPALRAEVNCFDDDDYLHDNHLVRNPGWSTAGQFLGEVLKPSSVRGYYQPLSMISLMLDYAIGGRSDNLMPFHRTSLILHACNTVLVIVLLYMIFHQPWVAAMVGLLFGLHPMTVETIPWVGERKTLLAAFFALSCLIFYVRYTRTLGWKAYAACLFLYVLALMSKPISTPLPAVMLLMDFWPLNRLNQRAVLEKIPFFVVGAIFAFITVVSQDRTAKAIMPDEYKSPIRIILVLGHNIIFYLYHMVWPVNLTSNYPFPDPLNIWDNMVFIGMIGSCLLIPALVISLYRTRALLTGWLIFFVAIFPTMGVIGFTKFIAADKFAYLPSIGLLFILAWLMNKFWPTPLQDRKLGGKKVGILIAVLVVAGLEAKGTRQYLTVWRDTETFFRYMLPLAPNAPITYNSLGLCIAKKGRDKEAIVYYRKALELKPDYHIAHNNMGIALAKLGEYEKALKHYEECLKIKPNYRSAMTNIGNIMGKLGKIQESAEYYKKALKLKNTDALAHNNLANAMYKLGQAKEAVKHYRMALKLKFDYPFAHNNLATALSSLGKTDEAIVHYNLALRMKPDYPSAYNNLGTLHAQEGKYALAIENYKKALKFDPKFAKVHYNLGRAFEDLNRFEEALGAYQTALTIDPGNPNIHRTFADLLSRLGRNDQAVAEYRQVLKIDPLNQHAQNRLKQLTAK